MRMYILRRCLVLLFFLDSFSSTGQALYNFGAMYIDATGNMGVHSDMVNTEFSVLKNAGNIYALSNIEQNGITGYDQGTLRLTGSGLQTINGSENFKTTDIYFDNAAGINLLNTVSVSNGAYFENGIVSAADSLEPLEFNPNGVGDTAIAALNASDASHVNGYVSQAGTGSFDFPVGDGSRYQAITANIGTNPSGLRVRYYPIDAGTASFLGTGADPTPLLYYNQEEYWEMMPVASGDSFSAGITVYYDDYNNTGIGTDYATALKVAHQTSSGWQNEGGIVSGTESAGAVSSIAAINNQGNLFTLGSISEDTPLPVTLTYFSASVENCDVQVRWGSASESAGLVYFVEYSTNGRDYNRAGSVYPLGENATYSFTHQPDASGQLYYRLAIQEPGSSTGYSKTVPVLYDCQGRNVTVYPNPLKNGSRLTISLKGHKQANALIYDMSGRVLQDNILLNNGNNTLTTSSLAPGLYWMIVAAEMQTYTFKVVVTQ